MPWDVIHQELYLALSYRNRMFPIIPVTRKVTMGSSRFVGGGSVTLSRRQGVADVTTVHTVTPAQNVVVTTGRNSNVASLTKPLWLLNRPTPVIVGNLQLMLSDSRYDCHRISSKGLVVGLESRFVALWTMLIIHVTPVGT